MLIVGPDISRGGVSGQIFMSNLEVRETGGGEGAEALVLENASVLDDGVACEVIGSDVEATTERRVRRERSGANGREESQSTCTKYPSVILESVGDYESLRSGESACVIELQFDDNRPLHSSTVAERAVEELNLSEMGVDVDHCFN